MKKITFLLCLIMVNYSFAQTWTTGEVNLTTGYTVQFDINEGTGLVTMTMIGPEDKWIGVGPGIMTGNMMGNLGDDTIIYSSTGLEDRSMPDKNGKPSLDASQDWTLDEDTVMGGVRTVVANRAINTGDPEDFVFPTQEVALPILWATGSNLTFGYHEGNKGGLVTGVTLGNEEFENPLNEFRISPNPGMSSMTIKLASVITNELNVEVFDVIGKRVLNDKLSTIDSSFDVSKLNSGVYLVNLSSKANNIKVTKRFVKL